ncbi:hypothetical protein [Endozoicomonas sp. ONNA2]|uniref:hypothetical protein n=1 Tax=Endozoicomonas sp. ONNA2 TaxID=2828741 RepID=UPI0021489219|nr:hypothetical protein [Endozoicomonas sp. ONNA2]
MFNLPRNPLCTKTPGLQGPGSTQPSYQPTSKEAEAPVGYHRGRKIKTTDTTSYLAEEKSVVPSADSPSQKKAEATPVPAQHTTGLKENKLDSQGPELLQRRAELLEEADTLLGTINEQKAVGISLGVLETVGNTVEDPEKVKDPKQVLALLKKMKFPDGLNVKITLKSQPDKPLSLIPPSEELTNQTNLVKLMNTTIATLKRHQMPSADRVLKDHEAEKLRDKLVENDNEVAGRDTRGQGKGAQAFDKLKNRRCAITVHPRTPIEQGTVEARHHETSFLANRESSATTAREAGSDIENGDGNDKDLTTTAFAMPKQAAITEPPMNRPNPVYPVPLPLVNSSQTVIPPQPKEAQPALPQSEQQASPVEETSPFETEPESTAATGNAQSTPTDPAITGPISALEEQTDAIPDSPQETAPIDSHSPLPETKPEQLFSQEEIPVTDGQASGNGEPETLLSDLPDWTEPVKTAPEQPNHSLPKDELQSTGSQASISTQEVEQASLSDTVNPVDDAIAPTTSGPTEQSDVQPAMTQPPVQQAEMSTPPATPKTAKADNSSEPSKARTELHKVLIKELENRKQKLKQTNQPIAGNSPQGSGSPNHDTAPEASQPGKNPELIRELSQKLGNIRPKTPEEVEKIDSNVARRRAQTAEKNKNANLPFADELIAAVAQRRETLEKTTERYKPISSSVGYKPVETTVSFHSLPTSDELSATAASEQIAPPQTDSNANDNIVVPNDETTNTSSSNKKFNEAEFKEELKKAVEKMMNRRSNTTKADNITDSPGPSDPLPEELTNDLEIISDAVFAPEKTAEHLTPPDTQPTQNSDATMPLPPPAPPISEELLLSSRRAPAATGSAQANGPDNTIKTESGNVTKSKPSSQGFFGSEEFTTALGNAANAMNNKLQSGGTIEEKIARAKAEAEAKKLQEPPRDVFGVLRKQLRPIERANYRDDDGEFKE